MKMGRQSIAALRENRKGIALGALLFLPLLPSYVMFFLSDHLKYITYGIGRYAMLLFVSWLILTFPRSAPRTAGQLIAVIVSALLASWSQGAGLSGGCVFFGTAALVLWRESSGVKIHWARLLATLAILLGLLLPAMSTHQVYVLRQISLILVDHALQLTGIAFERTGISYFISGSQVGILESCSGSTMTRMFFVLLSALFLFQKRYLFVFFIAPLSAVVLGLTANTLRILIHLALVEKLGKVSMATHEVIGMGTFSLLILGTGIWLLRKGPPKSTALRTSPAVALTKELKPSRIPWFASITLLVAAILPSAWFVLSSATNKQIEHQYFSGTTLAGNAMYINHFVEHRGGGGWTLLEHPIEYCAALKGWNIDNRRLNANQNGHVVAIHVDYALGNDMPAMRLPTLLKKWANPALWNAPLDVQVRIETKRN